jgi:hypothetical protein
MVNSCAVCGCCTRTDIVGEHLEDTLRICDVSAMGLYDQRLIAKKLVMNFLTIPSKPFALVFDFSA